MGEGAVRRGVGQGRGGAQLWRRACDGASREGEGTGGTPVVHLSVWPLPVGATPSLVGAGRVFAVKGCTDKPTSVGREDLGTTCIYRSAHENRTHARSPPSVGWAAAC